MNVRSTIKLILLICIVTAQVSVSLAQTIIYVRADAACPGNGNSWATAYCHLQTALANATSGSQIWVKTGTYYPDEGSGQVAGNRNASFHLINGVAIYGGFAGTETMLSQRNWENNETILSGNIGNVNVSADNSYTVVFGDNVNNTAILDGFTIEAGYANAGGSFTSNGANISLNSSSPLISNCIVQNGFATGHGGGAHIVYSSNPVFTNVQFLNNQTNTHGGALGVRFNSSPVFNDCTFINNSTVVFGGVMHCRDGSSPTFDNCWFENNASGQAAGTLLVQFNSSAIVTNSTFLNNHAGTGSAAMHMNDQGNVTIDNCWFEGNTSTGQGAVIGNRANSTSSISNSVFINNSAGTNCGAVRNAENSQLNISNCEFINNSAGENGGAVYYFQNASGTISNCTFQNNSSGDHGGAIALINTQNVTIENCEFHDNEGDAGGAIYLSNSSQINIQFCDVLSNDASLGGGIALYNGSNANLLNIILQGNTATSYGGGILLHSNSTAGLINTLIAGNQAGNGGGIATIQNTTLNATNITIAANHSLENGGGILQVSNGVCNLKNTIVYANQAQVFGHQICNLSNGIVNFEYSCYQNETGDIHTTTPINEDANTTNGNPNFEDPVSALSSPNTGGSYRLIEPSFAIDAGNNDFIDGIDFDLDGADRIMNDIVDMGAYETEQAGCVETFFVEVCSQDTFMGSVILSDTVISYTFLGSDGCDSTHIFIVETFPDPMPEIFGNPVVCFEETTNLSVSNEFTNVVWSNGETGNFIENAGPGSYSVTVTDQNGCTGINNFVVIESTPVVLQLAGLIHNSDSLNPNGSITVSASGGTAPYTYIWDDFTAGPQINNLAAGIYCVTVTDVNDCSDTLCIEILFTESPFDAAILIVNATCYDWMNGQIEILIMDGNPPFQVTAASNSTVLTATLFEVNEIFTFTNVPNGVYQITISDSLGQLIQFSQQMLSAPLPLELYESNIVLEHVSCHGQNDGSITLFPSGGTPPYTFHWSQGSVQSTSHSSTTSNLGPGEVHVYITDFYGCELDTVVFVIEEADPLLFSGVAVFDATCYGFADGSIYTGSGIGGVSPYTYILNFQRVDTLFTGLPADTYTLTMIDSGRVAASIPL